MTTRKLTLQTLTPIHIGDGEELRLGFDFAIRDGRTWRLDEDAILEAKWVQMGLDKPGRARYPLPGELLNDDDFRNGNFFRYVLRGAPRSRKADARLKTFIKDHEDRPYIPGSSLKGALRTALAWRGWDEVLGKNYRVDRRDIGNSRSWAGQQLERKLFGKDPNHDLLRALQVSDLHGNLDPGEALAVVNAQVLTRGSLQSPIELEALLPNRTLTGSITIEDYLFSPQAERELGFGSRKAWLDALMQRVQEHSHARLEKLLEWFESVPGAEKIANFYQQLYDLNLSSNQALVQIGWGSGWDGKTFWTHLQKDELLFEKLMRDFRLQHRSSRNAPPTRAKDFPVSRRVVVSKEKIAAPFGWAIITLEEK
jgi:CRISPR-associated protein Csm5